MNKSMGKEELLEELDKATSRISEILVTGYPELNKWGRAKAQLKAIVEYYFDEGIQQIVGDLKKTEDITLGNSEEKKT